MRRALSVILLLSLLLSLFGVTAITGLAEETAAQDSIAQQDETVEVSLSDNPLSFDGIGPGLTPKASFLGYSLSVTSGKSLSLKRDQTFTIKLKANKSQLYGYLKFSYNTTHVTLQKHYGSGRYYYITFKVTGAVGSKGAIPFYVYYTQNGSIYKHTYAKVSYTVKATPVTSVQLAAKKKTLYVDPSGYCPAYTLAASVKPSNATNQTLTFSSSKSSVASVDKYTGVITAKKKGAAKITVKASNGKKATCTVTVKATKTYYEQDGGDYRALMIVNGDYYGTSDDLKQPIPSANALKALLPNVRYGGRTYSRISMYTNQTGAQMRALLSSLTAWGIEDDDVTLFYYAGHGALLASNSAGNRSYLCGIDTSTGGMNAVVSVPQLQSYLSAIPGTVYVILDCCHSGGFISKNGVLTPVSGVDFSKGFTDDVISAFATAAKDLRSNKFHVLTAAAESQFGLAMSDSTGRNWMLMTKNMVYGGGYDQFSARLLGKLPADTNGDGRVSFAEAQAYTQKMVNQECAKYNAQPGVSPITDIPRVQIWPVGDSTQLFGKS